MNALAKLLNSTGPERTAWLERQLEPVKNALASAAYYVPPELRQTGGQVANALAMMSPGADFVDAAQSSGDMMDAARRGDVWGMAGAGAGIAAAAAGLFVPGTAKGYGSAAEEIAGMLRAGRGAEITDEMIAKADPAELFDLYAAGKTGMDMPMDEASRMARAQGMGFDTGTPLYHGTGAKVPFDRFAKAPAHRFSADSGGPQANATWLTEGRGEVNRYAGSEVTMDTGAGFPTVMPVTYRPGKEAIVDGRYNVTEALAENPDSVNVRQDLYSDLADEPQHWRVVPDPANIRSRFARFDPRLKHLANLSAAGAGVVGYNALTTERDRNDRGGM
jgi:hypothetical protein